MQSLNDYTSTPADTQVCSSNVHPAMVPLYTLQPKCIVFHPFQPEPIPSDTEVEE